MPTMRFARQASAESETTRQTGEAIKTACAFRSTSVERERYHGGVKSTHHLAQFRFSRKTQDETATNTQTPFSTFSLRSGLNDLRLRLSMVMCWGLAIVRFARPASREIIVANGVCKTLQKPMVAKFPASPRRKSANHVRKNDPPQFQYAEKDL